MINLLCAEKYDSNLVLRINKKCQKENIFWIYLGRDYFKMTKWEKKLGQNFKRIFYAKELNNIAYEMKGPYLEWIAKISHYYEKDLAWWTSRISERQTLFDSFFHLICYYKIGLHYALKSSKEEFLVIAENPTLLATLKRELRSLKIDCISDFNKPFFRKIRSFFGRKVVWYFYFINNFKKLKGIKRSRIPFSENSVKDEKTVIIHTFIDENFFQEKKYGDDRFFPGLAEELNRRGYKIIIIPWLYNIKRSKQEALAWFRERGEEYLIPEEYYSIFDILWSLAILWRQKSLPRKFPPLLDINLKELLKGARGITGIECVLCYRFFEKLARKKFKFDVYITMFENLVVGKTQILGVKTFFPNVLTVGFQHYSILIPLILTDSISPNEAKISPHPDVIVCNSPFTKWQLIESGFDKKKLRIGPSLRYQYLIEKRKILPKKNSVLVILALEPSSTQELLYKLFSAFSSDDGIEFLIKPHPMMSEELFFSCLSGEVLPNYMKRVEGDITNWLIQASCVVSIASSVSFDAAIMGIPVIQLGRETDFTQDPLVWFPELGAPVYLVEELRKAIFEKLNLSLEEKKKLLDWADRMYPQCISPISDQTIDAFVEPLDA